MTTGIVKFFNEVKGFGFIQPIDGGSDVFVHITAVKSAGMDTLRTGDLTFYEVVTERGRPAAANLGTSGVIVPINPFRHAATDHAYGEPSSSHLEGLLARFLDASGAEDAATNLSELYDRDEVKYGVAGARLMLCWRAVELVTMSFLDKLIA